MAHPQIFISYSTRDKPAAIQVCDTLERSGVSCWIAPRNVRVGKFYAEEIISALRECPVVLLLLSSASTASPEVAREIDRAMTLRREVLILRIEEVEASGPLEYYLSGKQWLDAFPAPLEPHLAKLCDLAGEILGAGAPTETQPETQPQARSRSDSSPRPRIEPQPVPPQQLRPGLCLPWTSSVRSETTVRNASVLFTDYRFSDSDELKPLVERCRKIRRPLVVVAPVMETGCVELIESTGGFVVQGRDLTGQPMEALFQDLSICLGGYPQVRELGFGLPNATKFEEEVVNGVIRGHPQVAELSLENHLGMAREVWSDGRSVCFEAEWKSKDIKTLVRQLKFQATTQCVTRDEFEGLRERLRRLGVDAPLREQLIAAPAFKRDVHQVTLPTRLSSSYFITDATGISCTVERPRVLVVSFPIFDEDLLLPAMEFVSHESHSETARLTIFAPGIRDSALAITVVNKLRGFFCVAALETDREDHLKAVAKLTGAEVISHWNRDRLLGPSIAEVLGKATDVVADLHQTKVTK